MRLAWLVSLGFHASLIGVFVLHPFGSGLTPPRAGTARIGFASDESTSFESRPVPELSAPRTAAAEVVPAPSLDLPLVRHDTAFAAVSAVPTTRVPARRPPPVVLSSTTKTIEPALPSARSEGTIAPASPLRNPDPRYPSEARRRGWQGQVLLLVRVATDGSCIDASVIASSGHRCLDEAALDAVRRWTFAPSTRDGVAIQAEVEVPVNFVLR